MGFDGCSIQVCFPETFRGRDNLAKFDYIVIVTVSWRVRCCFMREVFSLEILNGHIMFNSGNGCVCGCLSVFRCYWWF